MVKEKMNKTNVASRQPAKVSKTNVAARQEAKARVALCRYCGTHVETVLRVPPTGKKHMARLCCERKANAA
jgi:hypothetical protein